MEIEIRNMVQSYLAVVRERDTIIIVGPLDGSGRKALAQQFINAAEELLSGLNVIEGKDNG